METTPIDTTINLLKRSSMSDPDKYPLYVFLIILGCVVGTLIGFSIYMMYHGLDDSGQMKEIPYEQRKYMRESRQRNLNALAVEARRPDMIIPIEHLNV
ncbi:uncharacterized protein N7529_005229 [Penicillium soppii]|jgi:hypothetical protein|uniref:uncharacterized protein n=1 Tax=Penicillium soppii TaxID=69789 RepID=UPI002547544A|nr:uncharacterized protein N7529_005229 [Penicillium soppii]KAJ5872876.1 hypothetical protein N7529_005229 [Penicillium soppii]